MGIGNAGRQDERDRGGSQETDLRYPSGTAMSGTTLSAATKEVRARAPLPVLLVAEDRDLRSG